MNNQKSVLISGGSEGLGFALAKIFSANNFKVYIISNNLEKLKNAASEINSENLKYFECDLTDYTQIEKIKSEITSLDILINNAAVFLDGELTDNSPEQISKVIDTNYKGLVFLTHAFLGLIKQSEAGFVVNISSTSGLKGKKQQPVYSSSKWAVRGFTESLKEDLADTNVKVIGVYPGGMKTKLFEKSGSSVDNAKYMEPEDVAKIIFSTINQPKNVHIDHIVINKKI